MGQIGNVGIPESVNLRTEYAYIRNKIVPIYDANVNIMTQAFLFGTAIHEGLRGYYNTEKNQLYVFRMKDHYERMCRNAKILKMDGYKTVDELCEISKSLLQKNAFKDDCYMRSIMYKSAIQYGLLLENCNDFAAFCVLQKRFQDDIDTSINVGVSSWQRIEDNMIPARAKINGAYVNSCLAMTEALDNGFDDAIFLNASGKISEGSGMNIFIIKNNVVYTPLGTDSILEGITRDTIITILEKELNLKCETRSIDRTELYMADEIFLVGTAVEIIGVKSVDRRIIGRNNVITNKLKEIYFNIVRGNNPKYFNWLYPVY
ncbi:branched-chain amino acid transaminase [Phascolarctobacterium sp.]